MAQYIDKYAVIAEIEKKKIPFKRDIEDGNYPTYLCALMDFEDFINTLEVKEVDFNTEVSKFIDTFYKNTKIGHRLMIRRTAKYFFELGLKTQKGE